MKSVFSLLCIFTVLLFTSCDKEQAVLNDVAGDWTIANVSIELADGSFLDNTLTGTALSFTACDGAQNQSVDNCDFTARQDDGSPAIFLKYNVVRSPSMGGRVVQFFGTDRNDIATEQSLLYQVLNHTFRHEVSGDQLTLATDSDATSLRIDGQTVEALTITARR